jgi:tetratricopeptide (TPR) repeat protein
VYRLTNLDVELSSSVDLESYIDQDYVRPVDLFRSVSGNEQKFLTPALNFFDTARRILIYLFAGLTIAASIAALASATRDLALKPQLPAYLSVCLAILIGGLSLIAALDLISICIMASPTQALGQTLLQSLMRRPRLAYAVARMCTDCGRTIALAYCTRGNGYSNEKEYDRAIVDFNQAITLDPKNTQAYASRAWAYGRKKDYTHAIADYSQVIKLDPKNAEAFNSRGWYNAVIGQLQAALADCNQSLALRPNNPSALDSRGFTYLKLGRFRDALDDYGSALSANPKMPTAACGRAVANFKLDNSGVAERCIADAKKLQADIADEMAALGVTL